MTDQQNLLKILDTLHTALQQNTPDDQNFEQDITHLHTYSAAEYEEYLERRSKTPYGKMWQRFRRKILAFAEYYLTIDQEERIWLRKEIATRKLLPIEALMLISEQSPLVGYRNDPDLFQNLIALFSLADAITYKDQAQIVLSQLLNYALSAEIEIEETLEEIISISSENMQQFLESFEFEEQ